MYNKPDFYSSPAHGITYLSTQSTDIYTDCELLLLLMQNSLADLISETTKQRYTNPRKTNPETTQLLSCNAKTKAVNSAALTSSWRIISVSQDCILKHTVPGEL